NMSGAPWDEERFLPFWAKMAEVDRMIWCHPTRNHTFPDYKTETTSRYEIWWTLGWPYETSAFMARVVFGGLFDKHPNLKIITHHGGGMIPQVAGRVGPGWDQLGARTPEQFKGDVETTIQRRPVDYFKLFYVDTALMTARHAITSTIAFYGV